MAGAGASAGRPSPKAAVAWAAVVAWTAVVARASGEDFSSESTSRFVGPLLRWLFPGIDDATVDAVHYLVRKSAHVTEYGVLALFSANALRLSLDAPARRISALALALVLAVACGDETRQALGAVRSGSPWDVVLDVLGGAVALALAASIPPLRRVVGAPPGRAG